MSFLKIKDPHKRDELVKEYLATKRKIRAQNVAERLGEDYQQKEYEKVFKPITEQNKQTNKAILSKLNTIHDRPLELKTPLAIEQSEDLLTSFGPIAAEHMKKYLSKDGADRTFGFTESDGKFLMGDKEINFDNDDIIVGDEKYKGTKGLWELIVSKNPQQFSDEDLSQYAELLLETNAMKQPGKNKPKSSKSAKWNQIIKPIWDAGKVTGLGLEESVEDLINRFDLLVASKNAGNTNTKNEMTYILDKLLSKNVIDKNEYKILLKKC